MESQFTVDNLAIINRATCSIETPHGKGTVIQFRVMGQKTVFLLTAKHCLLGNNLDQEIRNDEVKIFIPDSISDSSSFHSYGLDEKS